MANKNTPPKQTNQNNPQTKQNKSPPKKTKNPKDNKFMREPMNTVFYISVSFLCSFTKISVSEADTQYSQPNSLSL